MKNIYLKFLTFKVKNLIAIFALLYIYMISFLMNNNRINFYKG
jgi:hypothetical protein